MPVVDLQIFVLRFFAVGFLLAGISHIAQPRLWIRFFHAIHRTGFAPFIIALYTLPQGLAIVLLQNGWSLSPRLLLTIAGWGMCIKSAIYLVAPGAFSRVLPREEESWKLVAAGILCLAVGVMAAWSGFIARAG